MRHKEHYGLMIKALALKIFCFTTSKLDFMIHILKSPALGHTVHNVSFDTFQTAIYCRAAWTTICGSRTGVKILGVNFK